MANNLPNEILQSSQAKQGVIKSISSTVQVTEKGITSNTTFSFRDVGVSTVTAINNFVALPFGASKIYVNSVVSVHFSKFKVARDYVFTLYVGSDVLNVNSESLISMGYKIFYKSDCLLELRSDKHSNYVYCEPTKPNFDYDNSTDRLPVEMSLL